MPAHEDKLKKNMTWKELKEVVEEWIRYGDDPFQDAMSWIYEQQKECKDPEHAEVIKDVLEFMEMLYKRCPHLR